jgi:hypothetical protein
VLSWSLASTSGSFTGSDLTGSGILAAKMFSSTLWDDVTNIVAFLSTIGDDVTNIGGWDEFAMIATGLIGYDCCNQLF